MLMFNHLQKLDWCCQLWFWNFVICICVDSLLCVITCWCLSICLELLLSFKFDSKNCWLMCWISFVIAFLWPPLLLIDHFILITSYNPCKSLSLCHDIVIYIFYNLFHLLRTSLLAIVFLFHNALFYLATLCIMAWPIANDILINFLTNYIDDFVISCDILFYTLTLQFHPTTHTTFLHHFLFFCYIIYLFIYLFLIFAKLTMDESKPINNVLTSRPSF